VTSAPTPEMQHYAAEVVKTRPTAVHSGINGDQSHFKSNTYHIGIKELPQPGGYTNRDWFDQMPAAGSNLLSSAVDTSKSTADMVADWANFERLFYDHSDPRRDVQAEYIGWNGKGKAERLDFIRNTRTVADDTHKWHDHDARKRNLVNSREATNKQLSVRRGETKEQYLASVGSTPPSSSGQKSGDEEMYTIEANSNDAQGKAQKVVALITGEGEVIGPFLYDTLKGKTNSLNALSRVCRAPSDNLTAAVWNDLMEVFGVEGWRYGDDLILQVPAA